MIMTGELTKRYLGKRVVATLIDYTIVWGFSFFYIIEFGKPDDRGTYTVSGWPTMIPVLFWFLFIVIMEQYAGGTLGHLICKIKVKSQLKEDLTLWRTFKRRMADCLEIAWCFGLIAYLLARNTQNNQRLGDILAKSYVTGINEEYKELVFDFEVKNPPATSD
jgi:uncharacterized RDD family membrane protein YckC